MKVIQVYDLEKLNEIIKEEVSNGKIWFRGHANHKYILHPSLYRTLYATRDQFNIPILPKKIEEFNNSGDIVQIPDKLYIDSFYSKLDELGIDYPQDYIEQICFAQHYGVKTRLLDWTTDIDVAYYFSQDGKKKNNKTAIYLLNPEEFNKYMSDMNGELYRYKWKDYKFSDDEEKRIIFESSKIKVEKILEPSELNENSRLTPYAVQGPKIDKRICRQSGNFVAFGSLIWPIEHYENENVKKEFNFTHETNLKCITKIILSSKLSNKIVDILRKKKIDKKYIYCGDDIKDLISKQAEISNQQVILEDLKNAENDYYKIKNNCPALFIARDLMLSMNRLENIL